MSARTPSVLDTAMPSDDDAEKAVLSCLLQSAANRQHAATALAPDWFYHPGNRMIFEQIIEMERAGQPVDLVLITNRLRDLGLLDKVGGPSLLAELFDFLPTSVHYSHYVEILKTKLWRRGVLQKCADLSDRCHTAPDDEVATVLQESLDGLFELQQAGRARVTPGFIPIGSVIPAVMDYWKEAWENRGHVTHGLATGFTDLDRRTMGLRAGNLILIAARPAMGKSALAGNIAECIALANGHYREFEQPRKKVGVVSAEMTAFEWGNRMVTSRSGVQISRAHTGMFSREDKEDIKVVCGEIQGAPIYILDTPRITIQELRQHCLRAHAKHDFSVIIVDYLQQFKSSSKMGQANRAVEVGEVAYGLKDIAKECGIPIIALVQIGRGAEDRPGGFPRLADLRESGDIEAAADIVFALHRPAVYERKKKGHGAGDDDDDGDEITDDRAQLLSLKFRNGSTEPIDLKWDGPLTRFSSLTDHLFSNNDAQREQAMKRPAPPMPDEFD